MTFIINLPSVERRIAILLTDLAEAKAILEVNSCDTSEDRKITFLIEWCSSLIEEILNRDLGKKTRTEFYNGTGTQKLLLKHRPVYNPSEIQVWLQEGANFGSSPNTFDSGTLLTYGTDYCLWVDDSDGTLTSGVQINNTSRSGILFRLNNIWPKPFIRQGGYLSPYVSTDTGSVKVTYLAGYTVDNLPPVFRMAMNLLLARLKYLLPLGVLLTSESYEERAISVLHDRRWWLMSEVAPMILSYKNWSWGGNL